MNETSAAALGFIRKNTSSIISGASGLAVGGAVGYLAARKRYKRKGKKRKSVNRNRRKRRASRSRKQRKPHTAGKRKDTSHRRIRYTKNNQPYVIMANGRARFISKRSVRLSRKRKGGRY